MTSMGQKAPFEAETLWMVPIDDLGSFLWWPATWGPSLQSLVGSWDFAVLCGLPQSLMGHTCCAIDMWPVFFTSLPHEGALGCKLSADQRNWSFFT